MSEAAPVGRRVLIAMIAVAALSAHVGAQSLRLSAPRDSSPEAFTSIADVVELPGRRALVVDDRETRMVLIDFGAGDARQIGRTGSGPAEYRSMGALLPRKGGGAFLVDFALRRLLPVAPDGRIGEPVRLSMPALFTGSDSAGQLYAEAFPPRVHAARSDTMLIVRWDPSSARVDTLLGYDGGVTKFTGGRGLVRPVFPAVDAWTVLPSGDIVIVAAMDYRLTVWRDGRPVRSFTIPFSRNPVSEADKAAYLAARAESPTRTLGAPGAQPGAPQRRPDYEFPATYPPFGGAGLGGRYLRLAANGDLWVERLVPPGSAERHYDVVDLARGARIGELVLRSTQRLVGLGEGGVYLAVRDADDIEYLRRYDYPGRP